jgi:hypothetical protein
MPVPRVRDFHDDDPYQVVRVWEEARSPGTLEQKRQFLETTPVTGGWSAYDRGRGSAATQPGTRQARAV